MEVELVHSPHPNNPKNNIALVYVNGELDEPSTKWLAHVAICGGRGGSAASSGTLLNMATEIAKLYEELDGLGLNWRNTMESDLEYIRDCYMHKIPDISYNFKQVSNDAMRTKMWYWFSFYTFQLQCGEVYAFVPTFNKNSASKKWHQTKSYLNHLNKRIDIKNKKPEAKSWRIMPKAGPTKRTHHALTESEMLHLRKRLRDIDPAYELIAVLMLDTGLRISAALEVTGKSFEAYFEHLNAGKEISDSIQIEFTNKGNEFRNIVTQFDLPLRTIAEIQYKYRADGSMYRKRKRLYREGVKRGKFKEVDTIWYLANGKPVYDQDLQKAFREASKAMGRSGKNIITPHWMRHTFATWLVMNLIKTTFKSQMENTGVVPEADLLKLLPGKLHHISEETSRIYIATALEMLGLGQHAGAHPMTKRGFLKDNDVQDIVRIEAEAEFGSNYNEEKFDLLKYAIARGKVVDDG